MISPFDPSTTCFYSTFDEDIKESLAIIQDGNWHFVVDNWHTVRIGL